MTSTEVPAVPRRVPEHHHDHRDVTGGWLRPAVFGAIDGMVTNLSLITGVAGGHATPHAVMLTGLAGMLASSFSMASGEYVSVRSQSEAALAEVEIERLELRRAPDAEEAELAAMYRARGLDAELASEVARQLSRDPEVALRVHTQEELGVNFEALPSPWTAAWSSMVAVALGSLLPLLPYLFGASSVAASVVLSAIGLFGVGALVSRLTARSALYSGLRQLLIGMAAAAVTFGVGAAVGSTLS